MLTLRLVLALSFGLCGVAQAADSPAIQQIRANYLSVNRLISAGQLKTDRGENGCGPLEHFRWRDGKGVLRRLDQKGYSVGMVTRYPELMVSIWFDTAGRLDFALYQEIDVQYKRNRDGSYGPWNDNAPPVEKATPTAELRVYFDDRSHVLRVLNKYSASPAKTAERIKYIKETAFTSWETLIAPTGCAQ